MALFLHRYCREELKTSEEALWDLRYSHTDREVRGTSGYRLASEWAKLETKDELLLHPALAEFRQFLPTIPLVKAEELVLLRRVCFQGDAPMSAQMDPPPLDKTPSEGRYNQRGDHVLYLSDSEDGVRREFDAGTAEDTAYIQRYKLPCTKLRIADLTAIPKEHFVSAVFAHAEFCCTGRGPETYLFSQFVAEMVASHFDGRRVPGVRGEHGSRYCNVVIFDPHPKWVEWLEPRASPYRLFESVQPAAG